MSSHLGGHRCVSAWVCSNQGKLHKNLVVGIPEHEWGRNTNDIEYDKRTKKRVTKTLIKSELNTSKLSIYFESELNLKCH